MHLHVSFYLSLLFGECQALALEHRMVFKQYLAFVSKHIPADSDKPTDIVQSLACLIAARLSGGGKLPVACGVGDSLDMDIVNAGILAGLEKISTYDPSKGTMRQFLYPSIAGAMQGYAW